MLREGVSAVQGRYVVGCVLENELERNEKSGFEIGPCEIGRMVVLPSMQTGRLTFEMRCVDRLLG